MHAASRHGTPSLTSLPKFSRVRKIPGIFQDGCQSYVINEQVLRPVYLRRETT